MKRHHRLALVTLLLLLTLDAAAFARCVHSFKIYLREKHSVNIV